MKPIPAIVEPAQVDIGLCEQQILVALAGERDADIAAKRHQQQADAARETAKARRLEVGRLLTKARGAWPERGPNAKGWGEFLKRVGIAESTARMYIDEYRDPAGFAEKRRDSARGDFPPKATIDPDREPRDVYLVGCTESRLIKIGSALEIGRRLQEIQLMSPVKLRVLGLIPGGGERLERQLHEFFESRRRHGEWFDVTLAEIDGAFDRPMVVRP